MWPFKKQQKETNVTYSRLWESEDRRDVLFCDLQRQIHDLQRQIDELKPKKKPVKKQVKGK